MQEVARRQVGWDEPAPSDMGRQWKLWVQSMKWLEQSSLEIPRCITPQGFEDAVIELHHFSDASERAYGCCSYIRCINRIGVISTGLVISRNKVAPIKQCTIPRLELQAAVLAAKMDQVLRTELDVHIDQSYFWVDSEIVLKYIYNEAKRFHVFVGNRVSLIRQLTKPSQWVHIPGNINPADVVSRGQTVSKLDQDTWSKGPSFLRGYKSEWTWDVSSPCELSPDDPEVKGKPLELISHATDVGDEGDPVCRTAQHFSSWYKIKRIVAWWLRLIDACRSKISKRGGLSTAEIREAEILILRKCQLQAYSGEIDRLIRGNSVLKSSPIRSLSPYVDREGLLRVGGRLSEMKCEVSKPCIISHKHPIAVAIVNEVHMKAHVGAEWTHSLVRQKFWIVKGRSFIKKVIHNCVKCKRLHAKPCTQIMADLPRERIVPSKPPFTYTGIDVFGPFYVKVGRSEVKRYGCMFTCMVTRAIHIEKIN